MIDLLTFTKSIKEFDKIEGRSNFFSLATKLTDAGFETEGVLLILATWNFAAFRYVLKQFDIHNLKEVLESLRSNFDNLRDQIFQSIDFDKYENDIKTIYNSLSIIKGIGFTGAPKIMHLKNPNVFAMWDAYIRGEKSKKLYERLETFANGTFEYKKYSKEFDGYIQFSKDMQNKFRHIVLSGSKSLAKSVDEFNYINITLAIQDIERTKLKVKSRKKVS